MTPHLTAHRTPHPPRLQVMLSSMLEGDAHADVIEHIVESLTPSGLLGLLNLHWQRYLSRLKFRRASRGSARKKRATDEVRRRSPRVRAFSPPPRAPSRCPPVRASPSQDREEGSIAFLYYSLGKLLTEESVASSAAVPLRKAMQRWEERDGKEILAAVRRIEIVDDDGKVGRLGCTP